MNFGYNGTISINIHREIFYNKVNIIKQNSRWRSLFTIKTSFHLTYASYDAGQTLIYTRLRQ